MSLSIRTPKKFLKNPSAKVPLHSPTLSSPAKREYKSIDNEFTFSRLPFVYQPKHGFKQASNWRVPAVNDYSQACEIGHEYAAHFVQYLKDNPDTCGSNALGAIVRDIDFTDTSNASGYWVGFFSHLERIIVAQVQCMDVFGDIGGINCHEQNRVLGV